MKKSAKIPLLLTTLLLMGATLTACGSQADSPNTNSSSRTQSSSAIQKSSSSPKKAHPATKATPARKAHTKKHTQVKSTILTKLIKYTNAESAGPTENYYYTNGNARLNGFSNLTDGEYRFSSDSMGRSATARAVLTYSEYRSSQGSRQGDPLAPPFWPENKIVAITFKDTGRTYHGYLYNRSHSIADSLLGAKSYTSAYNFTTGTRPQNVGADQNGGMRYAETMVEDYWSSHPGTNGTVKYQTTPIYDGTETMPRGSVVDIKSSDGELNKEIVVINSAEGIKINYNDGSNNATPYVRKKTYSPKPKTTYNYSNTRTYQSSSPSQSGATGQKKVGKWTYAAPGKVYVSDSDKYYTQVVNPNNYAYETKAQAQNSGATQAVRGNQYARP
ncbi:DNA/RNA non-specific endonuclease [Lentilactobacillus sp. Marseille-Q4993]|uniref:DNA/RNA non-specific endonuclease n=1 Tax=Lentilactobacillus sp. Marseille-Q4993 TaxID=3039492 RepID=UPI0024BC4547|nr:DNA/RNA non-specific endonuclease [Lentilactobacillus sp. Marseille-Q4993]